MMRIMPFSTEHFRDFRLTKWTWLFGGLIFLIIQGLIVFFIVIAPEIGLYVSLYLILTGFAVLIASFVSPMAPFWIRALFVMILGALILNYGFVNVSVGVGGVRATVAELVLMLSLFWVAVRAWRALWIAGVSAFLLLIYAIPPLVTHLPGDLEKHGLAAARDALPLFDCFFFFGGVAVVAFARDAEQWKQWRHRFLWLLLISLLIYFPLYPWQQTILSYSPRFTGYQQAVPLVGYFVTGNVLALAGLMATILMPGQLSWRTDGRVSRWMRGIAFVIFASALVMLQSRTTYIMAGLSILLLLVGGHGYAARRLLALSATVVVALAAVDYSGVVFEGRVGKIGLEIVTDQLKSVTGEGGLESGRSGVDQRKRWVLASLTRWSSTPSSIASGIGFGEPLTDFVVGGAGGRSVVVREPHNSYVSVLTRSGVLGFIPWLVFHLVLIIKIWLAVRIERRRSGEVEASYWLWMFMLFMSMLVTATVQPVFESPHFAVPYFFMAGMSLGEIARAKAGWSPIVKCDKEKPQRWIGYPDKPYLSEHLSAARVRYPGS